MLVSPRNPLNIGAVARAMANFGFTQLSVVAPYAPHWREAKSAVGAPEQLLNARETATLAEAVTECSFVLGTGTLTYRKPDQPLIALPELQPLLQQILARGERAALVFGPEKHGLTREDLSYCHAMVHIPTDSRQPSMNLGQAAAVCLYEIACRGLIRPQTGAAKETVSREGGENGDSRVESGLLERLAELMGAAMVASNYSPETMEEANAHDLRVLLRRLQLSNRDTRWLMGVFRRILHGLKGAGSSRG